MRKARIFWMLLLPLMLEGCCPLVSCPPLSAYVAYCEDFQCKYCANECPEGYRICEDAQNFRACGEYDDDPCRDVSPPTACPDGQECVTAECCIQECEVNASECLSQTSTKICGQYDQDACRDWSAPIQCGAGEHCHDGSCQACNVSDSCGTLGAEDCNAPNGEHRACRDADNDGCPQWVTEACGNDQRCENNQCMPCPIVCGGGVCAPDCDG